MMNRLFRRSALLMATAALAACGGSEEEPEVASEVPAATEPAASTGGAMGGMEGMQGGMEGMQQGGMAEQMQAHMQMMEGASGDRLMAMMPEHRQMAANMMAQMNREMREMDMSNNTEWNETVSALRQDLTRMPEMSAEELKAFLPEHQTRIEKLTEMHRSMMSDMQM